MQCIAMLKSHYIYASLDPLILFLYNNSQISTVFDEAALENCILISKLLKGLLSSFIKG